MIPIKFPGSNVVFAENQPEYNPLPALKLADGTVYTCWELTEQEMQDIVANKHIFFKQLTFNGPLQPILPIVNLSDDIELIPE